MMTAHRFRAAPRRCRRQRRGGLTVEMILVVVVLAIVTVAIVQFGVFYANAQQVALAARVGALEASQTASLSTTNGDPVPLSVISAIEHQLESSRIKWCHIRLEHNVGSLTELESELGPPADCDCLPKDNLPSSPTSPFVPLFTPTEYVRVTICVPLNQVFPKQISFFGGLQLFDATKTYEHTAVFRYEL